MSSAEEIERCAAQWLSRKDGNNWSRRDQDQYEAWLEASPAHAIAAARLDEVWKEADILDRRLILSPRRGRLQRFAIPTSIAASLIVAVTSGWMWQHRGSAVHRTKIGQHDEVKLADGSDVSLNTNSKMISVVADGTREVWLDHGEAFFQIAHDRTHPFVVHAGKQVITVLGTKFTVRQESDRFRVAVLLGRVRLASLTRSDDRPIVLAAGEVATAKGDDVMVSVEAQHAQLDDLAWRRGSIVFDRMPLGQAIAELNRYSDRKLVLTDSRLASIEIGGRFSTDNVESFAQLLEDSLKLKVEDYPDRIEVSS